MKKTLLLGLFVITTNVVLAQNNNSIDSYCDSIYSDIYSSYNEGYKLYFSNKEAQANRRLTHIIDLYLDNEADILECQQGINTSTADIIIRALYLRALIHQHLSIKYKDQYQSELYISDLMTLVNIGFKYGASNETEDIIKRAYIEIASDKAQKARDIFDKNYCETWNYEYSYEKARILFAEAVEYYNIANNDLFNSVEDILETDFIEYAFIVQGDSLAIERRNNQIGYFFYFHPKLLYNGLNNIIEMPGEEASQWSTIPYAAYPMDMLMKSELYNRALDYFDSISTKFNHDSIMLCRQFVCLSNLGYYGYGLLNSLKNANISLGSGMELFYWNRQYREALYYYDNKIKSGEYDPNDIMMRGACYDLLAEQMAPSTQRDLYEQKAKCDYYDVLNRSVYDNEIKSFVYARLGNDFEAIRHARAFCDTAVARFNRGEESSLSVAASYLALTQKYCMTNYPQKAKKSLQEAFSYNQSPVFLSMVMSYPFMESINDEITNQIEKIAKEQNLKRLETDTAVTLIEYRPTPGGVMNVTCTINGIEIDSMIFDSGAGITQISKKLAEQMRKEGSLTEDDYLGEMSFMSANSNIDVQKTVNLRMVKIGEFELHDVTASIVESEKPILLLGQSVLSNFIIEMNPHDHLMTLKQIKYKR